MNIFIWLGYLFFGVLLFCLITFHDKKKSLTKSQNIIFRIIYLLVLAGVFSSFGLLAFNENIFIVLVFEFVIRMVYTLYFLERDFFDKEDSNVKDFLIVFFIALFLNSYLFNKVENVFLSPEEVRFLLWVFVMIYVYKYFVGKENIIKDNYKKERVISRETIIVNYAKLKLKYGEVIKLKDKELLNVLYAIMVYENDRRPSFFRKIDNILYKISGSKKKLGVMQVMSNKFISDVESIDIVCKKLLKCYESKKTLKKDIYNKVMEAYDKDNYNQIIHIYKEIKKFSDL